MVGKRIWLMVEDKLRPGRDRWCEREGKIYIEAWHRKTERDEWLVRAAKEWDESGGICCGTVSVPWSLFIEQSHNGRENTVWQSIQWIYPGAINRGYYILYHSSSHKGEMNFHITCTLSWRSLWGVLSPGIYELCNVFSQYQRVGIGKMGVSNCQVLVLESENMIRVSAVTCSNN